MDDNESTIEKIKVEGMIEDEIKHSDDIPSEVDELLNIKIDSKTKNEGDTI